MSARPEDVVIVGAGIAGLALGRALRARGIDPLIVDRSPQPPQQGTARAAWMIRTDVGDAAFEPLIRRGAELWRAGALGSFRRIGGFLLGQGEADDVSVHVPSAKGRGEFRPDDGIVDAASALLALRPPPSRFRGGVAIGALSRDRGEIVATTRDGALRASVLVNAAGAWAGEIGGIPVRPLKRHLAILSGANVPADAPWVWDVREGFYFRPHEAGLLTCACDEIDSAPGDASVDPEAIARIRELAARLQPGLGSLKVAASWAGQRCFAPDRRLVAGWDERLPGVFHLAGLGGHGITIAPALAELAAEAIARGITAPLPPALEPFAPARFAAP